MKRPTSEERLVYTLAEAQWNAMQVRMAEFRREFFPLYSRVKVDCDKFKGFGTVSSGACAPNQLSVRLENGIVWFYNISDCEPAPEAAP